MVTPVSAATTLKGFEPSVYGFIKASTNAASSGLASFNNINMTAPTHAVAQTRDRDKVSRFGFQSQQSRIGANLTKENVIGHLEFDFVDFNKSSPTTQMVPRVRIASIGYTWEKNKVVIGQDWDIFGPANSYTYNYVGNYFLSGNVGFMRQQVQYLRSEGEYEIAGALGLSASNSTVSDADTELSKSPSYAFRLTKKLEKGRVGFSSIYSHMKFLTGEKLSHEAYGFNTFYEKDFTGFSLKGEVYYGQNLANIGALAIGKGTAARDVKEFGGFLSANVKLTESSHVFGGAGIAKADNRSEIMPFAPVGTSLNTAAISAPGIQQNIVAKIGYEYRITDDLSFLTELSRFQTNSKLGDDTYKSKVVGLLESGMQLRF